MMSQHNNQHHTYSDGVTRTPGVARWEYVSGLHMPTPGAAAREDYDDDGSSVEVWCCRTPDTDLRTASFCVRLSNDETGESAGAVAPQSALIALASRLLDAALHGLPVGLTDAEYHGYYVDEDGHQRFYAEDRDDGDDDQPVSAVDEHSDSVPGAPGNAVPFPGEVRAEPLDVDQLMREIRDRYTLGADSDQGDGTPDGAA